MALDTKADRQSGVASFFKGALHELGNPIAQRSPMLDGLRTIAILLVVNGHVSGAFSRVHGANFYTRFPTAQMGWSGVDLFFVLSGFFIGGQLWRELAKSGRVSFPKFMVRRGLRIWPLYFFMFVVAIVMAPPGLFAARHYGWSDLLFVTNYTYGSEGLVNGSWSLCAEEQFYILAPLLLVLIGFKSERLYRWLLAIALIAEPVIRFLEYHALTGHWRGNEPAAMQVLYFPLHTHSDGLIYGLLIANIVFYRHKLTSRVLPWLSIGLGFFLLACAYGLHFGPLNFSGLAFTFGGIVWLSTQREIHLFDNRVFYWLSRLSFGMYLNHEYMENWVVRHGAPALGLMRLGKVPAAFGSFLMLATFSALVAVVTFCLVEHPFLALRTRLLKSKEVVPLVAN